MKGIAVELPFVKFKYVKVDRGESDKSKPSRTIDLSGQSSFGQPVASTRLIVTKEAEITTLGLDPMISNASVIHELAYGRIESPQVYQQQAASYPAVSEPVSHSLDLVI